MENTEKQTPTRNFKKIAQDWFLTYDEAKTFVDKSCQNVDKVKIRRIGSKRRTDGFFVVRSEKTHQKKT